MSMSPDPDPRDPTREHIAAEAEAVRTAAIEAQARAAERLAAVGVATDPHTAQLALLAGVAATAQDLNRHAEDLIRASRLSRLERIALFTIAFLVLGLIGVTGFGVLRLNGLADVNKTNGQTVIDCTQPGGVCYQRAQDQTAAAVAQLNLVTIAAVECDDAYNGARLHACILSRIRTGK